MTDLGPENGAELKGLETSLPEAEHTALLLPEDSSVDPGYSLLNVTSSTQLAVINASPSIVSSPTILSTPSASVSSKTPLNSTNRGVLERLKRMEGVWWYPRWANIDWIPHRLLHLASTGRWMRGHGDLTYHTQSIKYAYFREEFLEGFLFIVVRSVHLGIFILIITQFQRAKDFLDVVTILKGGEKSALTIFLYGISKSQAFRNVLFSLLALPWAWGLARGMRGYLSVADVGDTAAYQQAVEDLDTESNEQRKRTMLGHCWHDGIRWVLPLHPLARKLASVSRGLRWDGRMPLLERHMALTILIQLFERSGGYTKLSAGMEVIRCINSLNVETIGDQTIHDLNVWHRKTVIATMEAEGIERTRETWDEAVEKLKEKAAKAPRGDRNRNNLLYYTSLRDNEVEHSNFRFYFDVLKERALNDVLNFATWSSRRWQKASCFRKVPLLVGYLYGRYLQWWLGFAPTRSESLLFWVFKLGKMAYALLFFVTMYHALVDYLHCPNQPGMTFSGPADWYGKFDEDCLLAAISLFNRLPNQPVDTFISELPKFYIPPESKSQFKLDLGNKGLSVETMAQLIHGFKDNGFEITHLDASGNLLGRDADDTLAFAELLKELPTLTTLNLESNFFGKLDNTRPDAMVALANALGELKHLSSLSLAHNLIGMSDNVNATGTIALGTALGKLSNLRHLVLADNMIGFQDSVTTAGTEAIGQGLALCTNLVALDLSRNSLGRRDKNNPRGTIEVANALANLKQLRVLNLAANGIGNRVDEESPGILALFHAIEEMDALEHINIIPNPLTTDTWLVFRQIISEKRIPLPRQLLTSYDDIDQYFLRPNSRTHFNFSGQLSAISDNVNMMRYLMNKLSAYEVVSLDLSENEIGYRDATHPDGTVIIAESLRMFSSSLTELYLGDNWIGHGDDNNTAGTIALGKTLPMLTRLTYLDLSRNEIATHDGLNATGTIALAQGIGQLPNLLTLDLSDNAIGFRDDENPNGTIALGQAIQQLNGSLTVLSLRENYIGIADAQNKAGTQRLAEALGTLTQLRFLDLSDNDFGIGSPETERSTIESIVQLQSLCSLDLSDNYFGTFDPDVPKLLLKIVPHLKKFAFNGMEKTDWGDGFAKIAQDTNLRLQAACEDALCTGKRLSPEPFECKALGPYTLSDTFRRGLLTSQTELFDILTSTLPLGVASWSPVELNYHNLSNHHEYDTNTDAVANSTLLASVQSKHVSSPLNSSTALKSFIPALMMLALTVILIRFTLKWCRRSAS